MHAELHSDYGGICIPFVARKTNIIVELRLLKTRKRVNTSIDFTRR